MSTPKPPMGDPNEPTVQKLGQDANPFQEIGHTGLLQLNGYVFEPLQRELQGAEGRTILRQMAEQDPTIAGILFAMEMLLRRVQYAPTPNPLDQITGESNAEFVDQCLNDMETTFADTLSDILTMLPFGWSLMEQVYKRRGGPDNPDPAKRSVYHDGRIGWRKWSIRAQESLLHWEIDANGAILGMWQVAPPTYELVYIPLEKALLFRTSTRKGNPEGFSPLIGAYHPWWYKSRLQKIEAIGVERDLTGLPVMHVPAAILDPNAAAPQVTTRNAYEQLLRRIRVDEQMGVMLPSDRDANGNLLYDLSLLASPGLRPQAVGEIIRRYDNAIAIRLLADFVTLGHEAVGSFALSESKTTLFMTAVSAWPEMIASVINQHAIPRLFRLNGLSTDALPIVEPGRLTRTDINEVATALQLLAQAGLTVGPSPQLMAYLLEQMDLPVPPELAEPVTLLPANPPPVSDQGHEQGDDEERDADVDNPKTGATSA